MDRSFVYKPLDNNLRFKNKCQVLFKPEGETFYRSVGDNSAVNLAYTIEETEVYSNESPDKDLALLDITKAEPTLALTLRQVTDFLAQVMFLTRKPNAAVAVPVVARAFSFAGMRVGDVADLGCQNVTGVVITGTDYVEGEHFQIDREAGRLELIKLPVGDTDADIEGTVSGDGSSLPVYGMMDKTQIRTAVLIRTNNRFGRNWEVELWSVQVRPDGELALGSDGDDFGELTVNGRLFPDSSKTSEFRFGRVRELPRRVL